MNTHKTQLSDINENSGANEWIDDASSPKTDEKDTSDIENNDIDSPNNENNGDSGNPELNDTNSEIVEGDDTENIVRNARDIRSVKARLQTKDKLLKEENQNENAYVPVRRVCVWLDDWQTVVFELEERNKLLQRRMTSQTRRHRGSMVDLHNKMFKKLLDAESETGDELQIAKNKIQELEKALELQKMLNDQNEANRRGSMTEYSDKMFQKLLDAEAEFDRENKRLNDIIEALQNELQIEKLKNNERDSNNIDGNNTDSTETAERVSKALMHQISQLEEKNESLNGELSNLQKQLKAKDLESETAERQRRGSIKVLSDNMMKKLLEAEAEYETNVSDFEKQVKELKEQLRLEQVKNESLKEKYSNSELGVKMDTYKKEIEELHKKNDELSDLVSMEQQNNEKLERLRQNSIHNLHNNMFQKLLDAEYEYEEEIEKLNAKIRQLTDRLQLYEMGDEFDEENNDVPINYSNMKNSVTPMGPEDDIQNSNNNSTNQNSSSNNNNRSNSDTNKNTSNDSNNNQTNTDVNINTNQNNNDANDRQREDLNNAQKVITELQAQNTALNAEIEELKSQIKSTKKQANAIERERRKSVTEASKKIFSLQLTNASQYHEHVIKLEKEFKEKEIELTQQITDLKQDLQDSERTRSQSVSVYQKALWKNILEAEDESERQVNEISRQLKSFRDEAHKLRKENELLVASKLNLIEECNQQLNLLRRGITIINKTENGKEKENGSWMNRFF